MRNGMSLHRLAPGGAAHLHPSDAARLGVEEGAQVEVATATGRATLPVVLDSSLLPGVVYVPFNQPGVPSLGDAPEAEVTVVEEVGG